VERGQLVAWTDRLGDARRRRRRRPHHRELGPGQARRLRRGPWRHPLAPYAGAL